MKNQTGEEVVDCISKKTGAVAGAAVSGIAIGGSRAIAAPGYFVCPPHYQTFPVAVACILGMTVFSAIESVKNVRDWFWRHILGLNVHKSDLKTQKKETGK